MSARAQETCATCGREVPAGEFCGACGAELAGPAGDRHRRHAFAADPGEHVLHLSIVSTLLPHLPHRRSAPFRIGFVVATALLIVLGFARLTGPALVAAAVVVPVLYLLYLYEVEVYEDEPLLVIGLTFLTGVLIGIPWALITGPLATQALVLNVGLAPSPGEVLEAGVALPMLAQLLMLAGPVALYVIRRHDEALDGFSFGAASALGFTLATTFANLSPELQQGLFSATPPLDNTLDVVQRGLLVPLVNATTTGLVAGALFLRRGARRTAGRALPTSLLAAAVVAVLAQACVGMLSTLVANSAISALVGALITVALLLWARVAIHHMLLAEAVEVTIGPENPCSHCHRMVPRMAFCPNCGIATRATPKAGGGRSGRSSR